MAQVNGWSKNPGGTARTNYTKPCPGCKRRPLKGEQVSCVDLIGGGRTWWHTPCREAEVAKQRVLSPYEDTYRTYRGRS